MKKTIVSITLMTTIAFSSGFNINNVEDSDSARLCAIYKVKLLKYTDKMKRENRSDVFAIKTFHTYKRNAYEYCKI